MRPVRPSRAAQPSVCHRRRTPLPRCTRGRVRRWTRSLRRASRPRRPTRRSSRRGAPAGVSSSHARTSSRIELQKPQSGFQKRTSVSSPRRAANEVGSPSSNGTTSVGRRRSDGQPFVLALLVVGQRAGEQLLDPCGSRRDVAGDRSIGRHQDGARRAGRLIRLVHREIFVGEHALEAVLLRLGEARLPVAAVGDRDRQPFAVLALPRRDIGQESRARPARRAREQQQQRKPRREQGRRARRALRPCRWRRTPGAVVPGACPSSGAASSSSVDPGGGEPLLDPVQAHEHLPIRAQQREERHDAGRSEGDRGDRDCEREDTRRTEVADPAERRRRRRPRARPSAQSRQVPRGRRSARASSSSPARSAAARSSDSRVRDLAQDARRSRRRRARGARGLRSLRQLWSGRRRAARPSSARRAGARMRAARRGVAARRTPRAPCAFPRGRRAWRSPRRRRRRPGPALRQGRALQASSPAASLERMRAAVTRRAKIRTYRTDHTPLPATARPAGRGGQPDSGSSGGLLGVDRAS